MWLQSIWRLSFIMAPKDIWSRCSERAIEERLIDWADGRGFEKKAMTKASKDDIELCWSTLGACLLGFT